MKKTKHFNISVPELGDVPDITQVSNAISDLEDATAGTLEIMKAEMQGTKITLTSVSRKTRRTGYYEGMSIRFKSPQDIEPNYLKTISVDELGDQTLSVEYKVNRNEYIDIVYEENKFTAYPVVVQKTDSVSNNSSVLVGTAKGVKTAYDKGVEALNKANQAQSAADSAQTTADSKVSKSGDTMTGALSFVGNSSEAQFYGYKGADKDLNNLIPFQHAGWSYSTWSTKNDIKNGFNMENNANSVLSYSTFDGSHGHQIGLSSDGNLYHRILRVGNNFSKWGKIWTSTNINPDNLQTKSKEVIGAINELNSGKENKIDKKSGFNLDKSDSVTSNSSSTLATSVAVKTAYDKGIEALNKADKAQSSADKAQSSADGKVSKSGDTMSGKLTVKADVDVLAPISKQPAFMIRDENGNTKSGYFIDTDSSLVVKNYTSNKSIALLSNGNAMFQANNLQTSSKEVIGAINELNSKISSHCPYNIGDIYITTNSGNPSTTWLGTTWEKIEGRFLLGTSGSGASKQTGGSSSVTLGVNNIPSHSHSASQSSHSHTQPAHSHTEGVSGRGYSGGGGGASIDPSRLSHAWIEDQFSRVPIHTSSAGGDNTGSAQPSISVGNTGGGQAFSIMPPYFTVHVWVRIG